MGNVMGRASYWCATENSLFHYENDDYYWYTIYAEIKNNAKICILPQYINPQSQSKQLYNHISKLYDAVYSPNEYDYGYIGLAVYNKNILN